jgi:hypothetical protein
MHGLIVICLQVFSLSALKVFTEDELDTVLCGENVTWSVSIHNPSATVLLFCFDH